MAARPVGGCVRLRHDPELGRFLSPDPVGLAGELNLYAYGDSDPVNKGSPTGAYEEFAGYLGEVGRVLHGYRDIVSPRVLAYSVPSLLRVYRGMIAPCAALAGCIAVGCGTVLLNAAWRGGPSPAELGQTDQVGGAETLGPSPRAAEG